VRLDRAARLLLPAALALSCATPPGESLPTPQISWNPERYVCYRAPTPPSIDGRLEPAVWDAAPWTREFQDIRGGDRPAPRLKTRTAMLWDDRNLYVAARMEEPHLWATLLDRDSVIYHDHDFELFIDPDGDTHDYYELEINALGTEWDLLLERPYRDGGPANNDWNIEGLRSAVHLDGTLNDPSDVDRGWTVEISVPWHALAEFAQLPSPPVPGDRWRMNFSRVEWTLDIVDGTYVKRVDPDSGEQLPEENWVWSPQGLIAMHYPEMWGVVQFSPTVAGRGSEPFVADPDDNARWALRRLYYAQREQRARSGRYTASLERLRLGTPDVAPYLWPPQLALEGTGYSATLRDAQGRMLHIHDDGHLW
jgi:Carbohydrate family 9 binding domain-like